MLTQLSRMPELTALRTRSPDDFSIALLDAWAIVCDILTFYQERIANEGYLRTATELVSIGELAKLIGYKVRPGAAASVALAFTIDAPVALPPQPSAPPTGAPASVTLDAGVRAQSVPDPGQQPATFETSAPIQARAGWNAISPRLVLPLDSGAENAAANVRLQGLQSALQTGDFLLLVARDAPDAPVVQRISHIDLDNNTQTTLVQFENGTSPTPAVLPTAAPSTPVGPLDAEFLWKYVKDHSWTDQTQLVAFAESQKWSVDALEQGINALRGKLRPNLAPPLRVFTLKTRAAIFGHNAPRWDSIPASLRFDSGVEKVDGTGKGTGAFTPVRAPFKDNWESFTLADDATSSDPFKASVDLDTAYPSLVVGAWLVLATDRVASPFTSIAPSLARRRVTLSTSSASRVLSGTPKTLAARILQVRELSRSDYLLSAKLTRVDLQANSSDIADFPIRTTHVLGSTEELPVAEIFDDEPIGGGPLMLDGAYLSLKPGQMAAVTGVRFDKPDETLSEVVSIASLALVDGYTVVTFDRGLNGAYVRNTVRLDANVAMASHGETRSEILGSGDASQVFQRFALKQPPLTYMSAANEAGVASTLVVRVGGVEWHEVNWLYGSASNDRVYTLVNDADGKTYVQFGDGVTGSRLPSGANNVQATYRVGIGRSGNVRAGQLSMLLSRPFGLKAVTNPLAATGGDDPESVAQARDNAPIGIRTLGRIVSLQDFADFARASAGIAKASASWLWDGTQQVACVTVAGSDGAAVVPGMPQYDNLSKAMRADGDGCVTAALCPFVPRTFSVAMSLIVESDLVATAVVHAVKDALRGAFSFDARAFGQPVYRSEVYEIAQNVPGVIAVTLDTFRYSGSTVSTQPDVLVANPPALGVGGPTGAELVTLEPGPLPGIVVNS